MTEKEYRQHPAISRSQLWLLHTSSKPRGGTPQKFKHAMANPEDPSGALVFGQVVHKLLLQPETFDEEFAVWDNGINRTTKAGKETWSAFLGRVGDRTTIPLTGKDSYELAESMINAIQEQPLETSEYVSKLLSGNREVPFFWTDEMTGEPCKVRLDCLTEIGNNLIIVDYKTCTDASNDGFMRDAVRYGYHFQAAMYSEGVEKNTGRKPLFVFIAQEKAEPYSVNVLQADGAFVQYGYDVYRELLGVYHYCRTTNNWYGLMGRDGIINNLSLPAWLARE